MAEEPRPSSPLNPISSTPGPIQGHVPAVPSPLNPDVSASKPRPFKPLPKEREQREKKDTLKKREANYGRGDTPIVPSKRKASTGASSAPAPMRYSIEEPKLSGFDPPKETVFASHEPLPLLTPDGEIELKKPLDHAENKKGYRYNHCIADPHFRHKQYYRQTDTAPFGPRMSFEDNDKYIHYDTSGLYITCEKGWRMARANVCAREGSLYYEVRIIRGVPSEGSPVATSAGPQPHVRMGWARREAALDAPVGFDGYSYGLTDTRFDTMHRSRPGKFFHPKSKKGSKPKTGAGSAKNENNPIELKEDIREGDVIGLEISLPSLSLHQKVVNGVYNPAVDLGDGFDEPSVTNEPGSETYDVIRDRIPVPYKQNMYFETLDHVSTRHMDAYAERTLSLSSMAQNGAVPGGQGAALKAPPNPNHVEPSLRTLPHSSMRVYKNGQLVGTAFENLLAFLPPASAPSKTQGAREGFDDGMVGYFPAVACFSGGIAETNFGEQGFWMPPAHLKGMKSTTGVDTTIGNIEEGGKSYRPGRTLRPAAERYKEQIAEDVVWDIIDEVDFFVRDGGFEGQVGAGAKDTKKGVASLREQDD